MQKKPILLFVLSVVILLAFSCAKNDGTGGGTTPLSNETIEAKAFFDDNFDQIALLDRTHIFGTPGTRATSVLSATSHPDWAAATTYRQGGTRVVQAPLVQSSSVTALVSRFDTEGRGRTPKNRSSPGCWWARRPTAVHAR